MRSRPGRKIRLKSSPEELRASGVLLDNSIADAPMDLAGIFGNALPVEIEIGSGKGDFLLRHAKDRPEINLLGIEWLAGYTAYAADRTRRAGLKNIRLLCADAGEVFAKSLACESVQRVHIYFPDPWPKRKHRRRRLIQPGFVRNLHRALRKGGAVHVITDHAEYFQHIRRVLGTVDGLANLETVGNEAVGSNFERKYAEDGRRFYAVTVFRYG